MSSNVRKIPYTSQLVVAPGTAFGGVERIDFTQLVARGKCVYMQISNLSESETLQVRINDTAVFNVYPNTVQPLDGTDIDIFQLDFANTTSGYAQAIDVDLLGSYASI